MALFALGEVEPRIAASAFVHPDAVIIGDVVIGDDSSVWPGAVLRGDGGSIIIGARTSIQDGTVIHTTPDMPTQVGDDCVIGHLVHLEGCTILDRSLVGSGAVVLHGAVVGEEALVGAAALVPNRMVVPPRAMALGVPATLRLDAVDPEKHILHGTRSYLARTRRYRDELRRID
jgi:carbonic anhydrase/acetyltransferase-like protein (isoleucine patch superfamily)